MGYMNHHSIVVVSWNDEAIEAAHTKASEIFPWVSPISPPDKAINYYRSFFVPPDGSKEGWPDSYIGDEKRSVFVEWVKNNFRYSDGSSSLEAVEISMPEEGDPTARLIS